MFVKLSWGELVGLRQAVRGVMLAQYHLPQYQVALTYCESCILHARVVATNKIFNMHCLKCYLEKNLFNALDFSWSLNDFLHCDSSEVCWEQQLVDLLKRKVIIIYNLTVLGFHNWRQNCGCAASDRALTDRHLKKRQWLQSCGTSQLSGFVLLPYADFHFPFALRKNSTEWNLYKKKMGCLK